MCSNQPFPSVLNRVITIQNRRERLITAHVPCTFSNTRSKTRGTRLQMEAQECHPLEQEAVYHQEAEIKQEAVYPHLAGSRLWPVSGVMEGVDELMEQECTESENQGDSVSRREEG